ncbi:MAG: THUMP domain-containing protein [Bacteroidales bacterium]|nr:THUMP domain-containing protein [Bacteroidales bacterium]
MDKPKDTLVAKTFYGLEDLLAKELEDLGATNIRKANRAVYFDGDKQMMYLANYHLRTAISILKPIDNFESKDENDLYQKVKNRIAWDNYFTNKHTFSVEATVHSSVFRHSQYAILRVKDAIVDYFREKTGKRPYIDTENPDILINLYISERQCTISFNSSGEPLFKRGYRVATSIAPLNEVLAAGIVMLSGWHPSQNLIDPMCGSGTILIEAALIAHQLPPGIFRKKFGFETWPDFDAEIFEKITKDEKENVDTSSFCSIIGMDVDDSALTKARLNVKNAFLNPYIHLKVADFFEYTPPFREGVVITNPPYGKRIKKEDIENFYKRLGDKLKKDYTGFNVWIISNNLQAMKNVGLHPAKKIKLYNGPDICTLNCYEIYEGTKKTSKHKP